MCASACVREVAHGVQGCRPEALHAQCNGWQVHIEKSRYTQTSVREPCRGILAQQACKGDIPLVGENQKQQFPDGRKPASGCLASAAVILQPYTMSI